MTDQMTRQYTLEEAIDGLREIFREHARKEVVITGSTRLDAVAAECGSVGLEDLDGIGMYIRHTLIRDIENLFKPNVTDEEWREWFGGHAESHDDWLQRVAPTLTVERLAAIIVLRSRKPSFAPVTVFGHRCAKAGAFRGIEQVAHATRSGLAPFAPSTPIRDRLRGSELCLFWNRVRMGCDRTIPAVVDPLSPGQRACRLANWLTLALLPLLIVEAANWIGLVPQGLLETWAAIAAGIAIFLFLAIRVRLKLGRVLGNLANPLPEGITTFRDLAMLVAQGRELAPVPARVESVR